MLRIYASLSVSLLCLLSALWAGQAETVQPYSERDASHVYKLILPSGGKRSVLTLSTTVNAYPCVPTERDMPNADFRAALVDFKNVNQQRWNISAFIKSENIITRNEVDPLFKQGVMEGWKQFHAKYGDRRGYSAVSAIGFDAQHAVAIVYSETNGGPKMGAGRFRYFRRTKSTRREITSKVPDCGWIS
jgi:hypothetical protein